MSYIKKVFKFSQVIQVEEVNTNVYIVGLYIFNDL